MRDKLIKLLQTPHKAEELRKAGKTLPANDGCVEEIVADFLILNGVTIKTKPRTNFERITESVESLVEFVYNPRKFAFNEEACIKCPKNNCRECITEWLQKECEE